MNDICNIFKKNGELKDRYIYIKKLIKRGEKKFYLKYWAGSKRFKNLNDTEYYNMIRFLDFYNIKYKLGNDAPRGGVEGDYIFIISDKRNKNLKNIIEEA